MATRAELKERAKDQLGRKLFGERWINMLLAFLILGLLLGAVSATTPYSQDGLDSIRLTFNIILSIAALIVTGPLTYGAARVAVQAARKNEKADLSNLFDGFKESFGDAILLQVLEAIFIFLWSLLLIIPGIIKAYAYSMAFYIQQDQPNKDWKFCLDKSQKIMKGHKWDLFVLDLSFIGWWIVGFLCIGIGTLWVRPYYEMTKANFYLELVKDEEPQDAEEGEVIEGEITDKEAAVFDEKAD